MIEEKEKYINPFTDFGFKKLFGTEVNKDLMTPQEYAPNFDTFFSVKNYFL